MKRSRRLAPGLALALWACGCVGSNEDTATVGQPTEAIVLWAWDRPEDLTFLAASGHAVAVFESIVTIDDQGRVVVRPRLHPVRVPNAMPLIGVVRIESAPGGTRGDDATAAARVDAVATAVLDYHRPAFTSGLEIDYDARASERGFYRKLLEALRARLPDGHGLAITALASWCIGDPWLDGLPIDDAVPMLFRMGPDAAEIRAHLAEGGDFASPLCRRSVGLATDEPWPRLPAGRRLFLFHPRPWTAADVAGLPRPRSTGARG